MPLPFPDGAEIEFLKGVPQNAKRFDGMDKDLIFPQFCERKGELIIQGFEVLDVFSLIRYLARRFKYKGTTFIRQGDRFYDFKTRRWRAIRLAGKRKR